MHGQRSSATRVDERGEVSNSTTPPATRAPLLKRGGETRPPRPLRGHPSSREEGKLDHPARCAGTPPQERRGNSTTPPAARAPLLKRGGETRPPRPLRGHPSSREEGKLDHPARCAGTPPQERRGNSTTPPAARAPLLKRGGETRPPRPLRGHPSSREEGKLDHPARCAGTPPQERRGNSTTPPAARAPLLKRGGETRPPRPLRGHPSSREEGKLDHPARCAGTPPQERRGNPITPKSGGPERRFLLGDELGDPLLRQRDQCTHLRRGEGLAFGRSLDLDETARARHHHVHVGFAARILGVVQIEDGHALDQAHRHGGDEVPDRRCREDSALEQRPDRIVQGDKSSRDARGAGAPVCLDHVAVDLHGALAELLEVGHRAQGTADQALNFLRAPGLLPARRFAFDTGVSRARQHAVLRGHPALAATPEKSRHALLDARGADHAGVAERDQHRALRVPCVMAVDGEGTQFVGPALGRPHDRFCGVCLRIAARISSMALSISSSVRSLWSALLKSSSCVVTPSRFRVRVDTSPAIAPGCVSAQVIATTERLSESAPPRTSARSRSTGIAFMRSPLSNAPVMRFPVSGPHMPSVHRIKVSSSRNRVGFDSSTCGSALAPMQLKILLRSGWAATASSRTRPWSTSICTRE